MPDYVTAKNFLAHFPQSKQEAEQQEALERQITTVRANHLAQHPIQGNFDFQHLASIHFALFEKLYDHAGQLRPATDSWGKQNEHDPALYGEFAPAHEAKDIINQNSVFLQENNYLKDFDNEQFIYEFTICYAEVNFAHPFLEGNGRAIRVMFEQLAHQAGYNFDVSNIAKTEWLHASVLSGKHFILYEDGNGGYIGEEQEIDIEPLLEIMKRCVIKKAI